MTPATKLVSISTVLLGAAAGATGARSSQTASSRPDTVHLEVGSPAVNGTVYPAHSGITMRLRIDGAKVDTTGRWTNDLVLGDSAGRAVHRWHTYGMARTPDGRTISFDLWQTFDARTLALYGYRRLSSNGSQLELAIDGVRVRGTQRAPTDSAPRPVDLTLPRAGFVGGAVDLIPQAVEGGLREGLVITLPVWDPPAPSVETQVWAVRRRTTVEFEGRSLPAWELEHYSATHAPEGTIWLIDEPPYMARWDLGPQTTTGPRVRFVGERKR